jgi:hypothetical protein
MRYLQKKLLTILILLIGAWLISTQMTVPGDSPSASDLENPLQKKIKFHPFQKAAAPPTIGTPTANAPEAKKQFQKLIEGVERNLPTQMDLQKMSPEEAHGPPLLIQKAALQIGEIAQAISENHELVPQGLQFYQNCAENANRPNSIRAACFTNHEDLIKEYALGAESLANDPQVSDHVKDLAKKL